MQEFLQLRKKLPSTNFRHFETLKIRVLSIGYVKLQKFCRNFLLASQITAGFSINRGSSKWLQAESRDSYLQSLLF